MRQRNHKPAREEKQRVQQTISSLCPKDKLMSGWFEGSSVDQREKRNARGKERQGKPAEEGLVSLPQPTSPR